MKFWYVRLQNTDCLGFIIGYELPKTGPVEVWKYAHSPRLLGGFAHLYRIQRVVYHRKNRIQQVHEV